MLFDPSHHEPLTDRAWDADRARAAIAAIAVDTEGSFDAQALWRSHPRDDEDGPLPEVTTIYLGASGVIWALDRLASQGAVELKRDWAPVAAGLVDRYLARPDFPDLVDGAVPSLWMGEAGLLLVAHALAPVAGQEKRLLAAVHANAANPTLELMWGSPGTMIAANVLHERTGEEQWREAWLESANHLWAEWHEDLWVQDLYGKQRCLLGPAHGFAGNVVALAQGDLLDPARRAELESRAVAALAKYAHRDGELCQWWPMSPVPEGEESRHLRTQWCHGAPGIVASFGSFAPADDQLTDLLVRGGELTWLAGPLVKGAGLCHGTAGNGYAFLKLFERTGNELWLERARAFAMHSIEQVARARSTYGRGRHTLWTGDPGTALYLQDCLTGAAAVPTVDYL